MKRIAIASLMAMGALFSLPSHAVDAAKAQQIVGKNACMGCHSVENKVVGPAYKEVAAKYKDDKNAAATLAKKVKAGGSGVWGEIPMPANASISDADLKVVIDWILAGAPK